MRPLRYLDGFICYQNLVVTCPYTHEPNLTRCVVGEHHVEATAKEQCDTFNETLPETEYPYYYEAGRILDE